MFIKQVAKQLSRMTEAEKDQWILTQAKLLKEYEQQGFLLSLSGKKRVIDMPTRKEIDEFCQEAESGTIYLEYETHYYEFDDDGRYLGDWKAWHNDPLGVVAFLNRVFKGCRELIILGEYKEAADILDRVCRLEFEVVEAPDTDDFKEGTFILEDAEREDMLSSSISSIGMDWLTSVIFMKKKWDARELAEKLVDILEQPVCKNLDPSMFLSVYISKEVFLHMLELLNSEIAEGESSLKEKFTGNVFSHEKYVFERILERKRKIASDIRSKCLEDKPKKRQKKQKVSVLESSWKQIGELLQQLRYEPYIDDQYEISEIWNICEALIKRGKLGEEEWNLRRKILSEIIENDYYDYFGCYDPMSDLSKELCVKEEEFLEFADIMDEFEYYKKDAAYLYHKYGREDKYVEYLETHLKKESAAYIALIDYYKEHGNFERAREVGDQALQKCKDELTDVFIYLLEDAKKNEDENRYKKLYSSAKRRRSVNIARVDEAIKGFA